MSGEGFIRPAKPEDVERLAALHASWPTLPPWTRRHFLDEVEREGSRLLVWDEDGAPRGFAALRLLPPEAELAAVAVERDRLRRGIARRLMERGHALAREAGCLLVGLEVGDRNASARALYEALGYRVVGRRPKYYNDGSDALLMSLRL